MKQHCWHGLYRAFGVLLALGFFCAQASAQIVVVRVEPAAEPMCEAIEAVLADWQIQPDPGYFAEAQRQRLDPGSDQALQRLIPALKVRIAVVPLAGDATSVSIDFRDGTTGESLGPAQLPLVNGEFDAVGADALRSELGRRMGSPPSTASDAEGSDSAAPDPQLAEAGADDRAAMRVRMSAGAGMGARGLSWPSAGEMLSLDTGLFAAIDVGASFHVLVSSAVSLGLEFWYQTSIAAKIQENHTSGESETLRIRASDFAAVFALGLGGPGFRVTPAFGYATRGLRPEVHHLLTPSYSLAGPIARIGVRIPFTEALGLRLAPEAQYLFVGNGLVERGVATSGFGVGGEVAFELSVSRAIWLELSARVMRSWLATNADAGATDTERFATVRLGWQL